LNKPKKNCKNNSKNTTPKTDQGLKKKLKNSRELKETSHIVGTFLKEIDPKLQKVFNIQLRKQLSELPIEFYEIQKNSFTAIWNLNEENTVQVHLSACPNQSFKLLQVQQQTDLEEMVDKIEFLNFFSTFLDPTLKRLKDMNGVLERLKLGLQGTHLEVARRKLKQA